MYTQFMHQSYLDRWCCSTDQSMVCEAAQLADRTHELTAKFQPELRQWQNRVSWPHSPPPPPNLISVNEMTAPLPLTTPLHLPIHDPGLYSGSMPSVSGWHFYPCFLLSTWTQTRRKTKTCCSHVSKVKLLPNSSNHVKQCSYIFC